MKVSLTGYTRLDRKLEALPQSLRNQAMRKATREVAKLTTQLAKQDAPHLTGALESSLKTRAVNKSELAKTFRVTVRDMSNVVGSKTETAEGLFTGDEFYAGMMEFGTKPRQTKSGANRGSIHRTQFAFLRPALYMFIDRKRRIFISSIVSWMRSQQG